MRKKRRITLTLVRELITYDAESGVLRWRYRDRSYFSSTRSWASWNTKHAGKVAFTARDTWGHKHGRLLGRRYAAHRLIFFWMTGRWPLVVDHIDHDRTNNRWENLRDVSAGENAQNRSLHSNNTSGACGVHYQQDAGYVAALAGRYLGVFQGFDEAVAVRTAAQIAAGFAEGHGAPRA
jgi:hypothetical protein